MRLKDYIKSDSGQLITTVGTGTAPLAVSSTTKVENLNVDKIDDLDSNDFMRIMNKNGYYGMAGPGGSDTIFIRTTTSGIIPHRQGSILSGTGYVGTSSWSFADMWSQRVNANWINANRGNQGADGGITLYGGDTNYMIALRNNLGTLPNSNNTYGIRGDYSTFFVMNDDAKRGWIFRRGTTNVAGINGDGTFISSLTTTSYISGNQGKVIIDSAVGPGSYTMLFRQKSNNGVFTGGVYYSDWELHYTDDTTVTNGTNTITHSIQLLDEIGITRLKRLYITNGNSSGVSTDNISGYSLQTQGNVNINGTLYVHPAANNFREGIRVYPYGNWSDITLLGADSAGSAGLTTNSWFIGNNNGRFYLTRAGSSSGPAQLACIDNAWSFTGTVYFKNNARLESAIPRLYIRDTSDTTSSHAIIQFGNNYTHDAAYIYLNGPQRTDDGGTNTLTIRNNVGNIKLDNHVTILGNITAPRLIGNADTATKLATPRVFTIGATGKAFDGSANVSWTPYEMRLTRALYNTDSNLNTFAQRGCALGMLNLTGTDTTINPNAQTGWHHIFQATWSDCADNNGNTSNEWCSQITVTAGTDRWYVRSRAGGAIANGTAWGSNWRRLVTSNIGAVGNVGQPIYVNGNGETVAIDWHIGSSGVGEHNPNNITYNMIGYYNSANGPAKSLGATTTDGAIYAQAHSYNWVAQIAQDYRNGGLYVRGKNNGSWTAWQRVIDTRNMTGLFTSFYWNNGTTGGPTINAVIGGTSRSAAIPVATTGISGVVTTGTQSFAGNKTFTGHTKLNRLSVGGYDGVGGGQVLSTASFICNDWVRTIGNTGWYSTTYGGGWYMSDTTWIRTYGAKWVYSDGVIRTDNQLQVGSGGTNFYANTAGNGYFRSTLGIGGTNVGYKLYVNGTGYFAGSVRLQSGNYNINVKLNFGDSEYVYLNEPKDDKLQIKGNGGINLVGSYVYIGAPEYTDPNTTYPTTGYKLQVDGTSYFNGAAYAPVHLTVGGYNNTSYHLSTATFICNSWIRTKGSSGWYNEDHGGGWWMADNATIQSYGDKNVYMNRGFYSDNVVRYGVTGLQYFNLSTSATSGASRADVNPFSDWFHHIRMNHANGSGYYVDLAYCFHQNEFYMRRVTGGTDCGWARFWNNTNMGAGSGLNADMLDGYHATGLLTSFYWSSGNTSGPIIKIKVGGTTKTATIPTASTAYSGVVTTGAQAFAGYKTFANQVDIKYATPYLCIRNTSTAADTWALIGLGDNSWADKAQIFLNGPNRTNDGGQNMLTIRNQVGDLRLANNVIVTGRLSVGGYNHTGYHLSTKTFICESWIRTCGATGWYNETYQGGWYMTDYTWIRSFNNRGVFINGELRVERSWATLLVRNLGTANAAQIQLGTNSRTDGAIIMLNDSARTADWGANTLVIRNNVGNIRLDDTVYVSNKLYGAVWNDYAEYRQAKNQIYIEPGRTVLENGDDTISISNERLAPGGMIVSDTFGFSIGQIENICETPIAVSGRVLAYPYEDKQSYKPGDAVCTGPNGTVSKMTREEIKEYPERIIGIVSAIPNYETWGADNIKVNGRIWIKVR